jgi:hypothetical protein
MSLDFIFIEAARIFGQALRITFLLCWWLGLGIASVVRRVSEHIQDNQVKGSTFAFKGQKASGAVCEVCGITNEAGNQSCFACGARL